MCHSYWMRTFEGLPERLADVRQYLRDTLGDDVDGVDDVVLVASELAGNAIRHSKSGLLGGHFVLQVAAFTDCWYVRIDDQGSTSSPEPATAKDTDETGRGLPVVAALARAWGTFGGSTDRTVWAEVPYPRDTVEVQYWESKAPTLLAVVPDSATRHVGARRSAHSKRTSELHPLQH